MEYIDVEHEISAIRSEIDRIGREINLKRFCTDQKLKDLGKEIDRIKGEIGFYEARETTIKMNLAPKEKRYEELVAKLMLVYGGKALEDPKEVIECGNLKDQIDALKGELIFLSSIIERLRRELALAEGGAEETKRELEDYEVEKTARMRSLEERISKLEVGDIPIHSSMPKTYIADILYGRKMAPVKAEEMPVERPEEAEAVPSKLLLPALLVGGYLMMRKPKK